LAPYRVVEGAIALLHWFRRLRIRWDIRDDIHQAFVTRAVPSSAGDGFVSRSGLAAGPEVAVVHPPNMYPRCYVPNRVHFRAMDVVLQALADPSRRTALEILRRHPAMAGELAEALPIARPGVSRHLRVLREAGLVDVRQDGQHRIYSLRAEALAEVDEWLGPYRELWRNRLEALHTEIDRGKKARE
jgi:DNA-binding transcriptional ArsR family regulator